MPRDIKENIFIHNKWTNTKLQQGKKKAKKYYIKSLKSLDDRRVNSD